MRKLLVLSFLFLSACGKFESFKDPRTIHGVNIEFTPYVELYLHHKGLPLSTNIPIQFADLDSSTAGMCTRWTEGWRQIEIDKSYWYSISENEKRNLIFHELGHCDLNRNHDNTFLPNGYQRSLMYYVNLGYWDFMESYYFAELFNPATTVTYYKPMAHDDTCVHDQ